MLDRVLLPSFYRPEFLAICLEKLAEAEGGREKAVWVYQDRHTYDAPELLRHLPEIREVCKAYQTGGVFADFRYIEREPNNYRGNPSNFLEAYKDAYNTDADFVYLVEDDVMVGPDFFLWHEAMMEIENPFISVGWHCIRDTAKVPPTEDPHAYVTSYRDFSSIGVCWQRENLEYLVRHANADYYSDMGHYMRRAFPGSPIPANTWTEQAGLITRLLHEKPGERLVCWAGASRVSHYGFAHGYHRPKGVVFRGSLAQRIQQVKDHTRDVKTMQALNKSQWDDCNLTQDWGPWEVENLYVHQHNPYVRGII